MGDPPAPVETGLDRTAAPPDTKRRDAPHGDGTAGGGSAEEQARIDREAGDVADDLADFA